jgi:aminoglycoside/choline kinase family phosphotransferase
MGDKILDKRLEALNYWLTEVLGFNNYQIAPASADASFRRYFRVIHDGSSHIVMDAPPEKENCQPFIKLSGLLDKLGLHVPVIKQLDLAQGFLLLTDLGSQVYLDKLDEDSVDNLYTDAINALVHMQSYQGNDIPDYDQDLLRSEMELFREWYLGQHLKITLDTAQQEMIDAAFTFLADTALAQPKVLVHRDYHSRNLMVCENNNPGILDFQDAVIGPVTYDLVSLLRDCYISWPPGKVEGWVADYHKQATQAGILNNIELEQLFYWFDLMGIQRHLKASGIFARLNYRDNKPGYLNDIPRTLGYIKLVAPRYPQLSAFAEFIELITQDKQLTAES